MCKRCMWTVVSDSVECIRQGGSILVHVGTNNADRDGTTRIVEIQRVGRDTEEDKS